MIINTTRFGVIEVDDNALISMPEGMIGFENLTSYCLIDHQPESVLRWFQSTQDADTAFLVIDPSEIIGNYSFDLSDLHVERLGLTDSGDAVVITTVVIDRDAKCVSTNLMAPVVINAKNRTARQVMLLDGRYPLRHVILPIGDASMVTA